MIKYLIMIGAIPKFKFPSYGPMMAVQREISDYKLYNPSNHEGCVLSSVDGDKYKLGCILTTSYPLTYKNCYQISNDQRVAFYLALNEVWKKSRLPVNDQISPKCDVPNTMLALQTLLLNKKTVIAAVIVEVPKGVVGEDRKLYLENLKSQYELGFPSCRFFVVNQNDHIRLIAECPSNLCFNKEVFFMSNFSLKSQHMEIINNIPEKDLFVDSVNNKDNFSNE